jgi:TRAP-type C4-dicarboxylate transport system permease small subunit
MNHFLPDWMFAAFAIGGWELFDLMARRWHTPSLRWGGGGIVAICLLVVCIRYILRLIHHWRHPESPDPDEWKNY